jgi:N-acyl-D-amino-acid deacylase
MAEMTNQSFDLILAGSRVVDGTGAPGRAADVGIRGDRIAAVGDLAGMVARARRDMTGLTVTPGFIDAHTHDDSALLATPGMPFKVSQGVTTVVVGNCGISLAPLTLEGDLPRPLDLLGDRDRFRFPTFGAYLAALDDAPPALNAVCLAGHTTLRAGALRQLDRPADAGEIRVMANRLEEALAAGAVGLSTGLYYQTAYAAPMAEVIELARVVRRYGGLYATHLRDESVHVIESMQEAFAIGRAAGVPAILSHHKVMGRPVHGRSPETLALLEEVSRSQPVGIDAYPYTAGATELRLDTVELAGRVLITFSKALPEAAGRDLADIARELGVSVAEAVQQLQPAGAIYFLMDEADVQRILAWPGTMIGSDGIPAEVHPHPRLWGTFPRVLGHYSRELGLFSLEEAVRRMTGLPAWHFGLRDRGALREGAYADLVVLDAGRVLDRSTYEMPVAPAAGIELVLVNGEAVWEAGVATGARPGRALRRQDLDAPMAGWAGELRP